MRLVGTLQRGNDADGLSMIVYYSVDDFKSCFQEEGEAAKMAEEVAKKKSNEKKKWQTESSEQSSFSLVIDGDVMKVMDV